MGSSYCGNQQSRNSGVREQVTKLASDTDPRVRLQVAIAANKLFDSSLATALLLEVLTHSESDAILPNVVWQNLLPHLIQERERVSDAIIEHAATHPLLATISPRVATRWLSDVSSTVEQGEDIQMLWSVFAVTTSLLNEHPSEAAATIDVIFDKVVSGELRGDTLKTQLASWVERKENASTSERWQQSLAKIKVITGDQAAIDLAEAKILSADTPTDVRIAQLRAAAMARPRPFHERYTKSSSNCWPESLSN